MRLAGSTVLALTFVASVSGCSVLSPDPSPTPDRATGRVELRDDAIAMNLDEAWWAEPGPSYEGAVPPPIQEVVLQLFYELGDGYCDLWIDRETDLSSGTLRTYAEELVRDYETDEDVSRGTIEPVNLPAGPAMRVRIEQRRVNPLPHTEYILEREGVVYRLACSTFDPRDDDWLSIAETIEFLPDVE